jgi:hypothetical protein
MATFSAVVQRNHYATVTVEADNQDDAHNLVLAKLAKLTSNESIKWEEENGTPFGFRSVFIYEEKDET